VGNTGLHLTLEERKKWVVLVFHETARNTLEGSLESLLLDVSLGCGVLKSGLDLLERSNSNFSKVVSEVVVLKVLNHLQHVERSSVEVLLNIQLLVCQVVNECSLLDEVVLGIDADVFHLLLGVSEMSKLLLLSGVSPHAAELLSLVACVHVVEHGKLGTNEVGEVADFDVTEVESNEELVMEDHTTDPLVVGPATEARDRIDGTDVEEDEKETASAS